MKLTQTTYPRISIVTPSYNQGQYIEETILSVINQNYPNLEYIIIDGGSTDNTVEIIKKYEKYITYWVSEPDRGQSHAINKGLEKCTGDIFNWINSDDYYEPGALFKIAKGFKNKEILAVGGYLNIVNEKGQKRSKHRTITFNNKEKTIGYLRYQQLSTFIRLSAIEELGSINENLHYAMDVEWWFKFLLYFGETPVKIIEGILVNFRVYPNSKTGSISSKLLVERNNILYQFFTNFMNESKLDKFLTVTDTQIMDEYKQELKHVNDYKNLAEDILNYFYMLNAEIQYANSKFSKCKEYLELIDLSIAYDDLIKDYKRFRFRSTYLSSIIYLKQKIIGYYKFVVIKSVKNLWNKGKAFF